MSDAEALDDAFRRIEGRTNLEKGLPPGNPNRAYRLDRMRALAVLFDDPQDSMNVVHVAGSKGKGSTGAYIASLLTAAGRKVGVYSSPHLTNYRERMRIEGLPFPEKGALDAARRIETALEAAPDLPGDGPATTFEVLTLMALVLFRAEGCDTVVLETGLGGRLDATNIASRPEATVLTPVEKEHTEVLGRTIRKIAGEKAGILKAGSPAWSAPQRTEAARVFRKRCRSLGVPLSELPDVLASVSPEREGDGRWDWRLDWRDGRSELLSLSMGGRVQAENAALALAVARSLEPGLSDGAAHAALASTALPGRSELLRLRPPVMLDGAHTADSIEALAEAFAPMAGSNPLLLFGSVLGKDHAAMARVLSRVFRDVIVTTPGTFKPSDPESVAAAFGKRGCSVRLVADPGEAWSAALEEAGTDRGLLVTGSFYMAGEAAARRGLLEGHGGTLG